MKERKKEAGKWLEMTKIFASLTIFICTELSNNGFLPFNCKMAKIAIVSSLTGAKRLCTRNCCCFLAFQMQDIIRQGKDNNLCCLMQKLNMSFLIFCRQQDDGLKDEEEAEVRKF